MVHEINNPLSYVLASVEMARTRLAVLLDQPSIPDPDRAVLDGLAELLGEAEHGALRVRDLVRDLRRFSSAEGAASDLIDLHAVIDEAIRLTEPQVRPVGALRRAYGTIPYVFGHAGQLSQVFVNLIINAAHALHAVRGGAITITTSTDDAHNAMISVHDDGCGIPPEHLPRVFDPFFSTHSGELGMGLGLSISLNICRDHQGNLSVESAPGQGTTFTVMLPAADPEISHATGPSLRRSGGRSPHRTPTPKTPRARVLVIDDEPQVTRALTRMLQDHHDVFALHSAQDALVEVLAGERFDVLLCDLLMPDMTGMDLYAKLMAYNPAQARRTLFMTGGAFTNEAAAFLDRYPSRIIQKPFSVIDLLALIETIREQ
jgi:CheY-like chemotaxis protein